MFFDKLGELTKNLGDKTSSAIELTKLKNRIDGEKTLADEELKKIGAFYYERFIQTGVIEDDILSYCQKAKEHYDQIDLAKEEIQRIKEPKENPLEKKSNLNNCPSCGEANELGMKFCSKCGGSLQSKQMEKLLCPNCSTEIGINMKFCGSCGHKMEG